MVDEELRVYVVSALLAVCFYFFFRRWREGGSGLLRFLALSVLFPSTLFLAFFYIIYLNVIFSVLLYFCYRLCYSSCFGFCYGVCYMICYIVCFTFAIGFAIFGGCFRALAPASFTSGTPGYTAFFAHFTVSDHARLAKRVALDVNHAVKTKLLQSVKYFFRCVRHLSLQTFCKLRKQICSKFKILLLACYRFCYTVCYTFAIGFAIAFAIDAQFYGSVGLRLVQNAHKPNIYAGGRCAAHGQLLVACKVLHVERNIGKVF